MDKGEGERGPSQPPQVSRLLALEEQMLSLERGEVEMFVPYSLTASTSHLPELWREKKYYRNGTVVTTN